MTDPIRYFLPGPSWVAREVRQAMTAPSIGHRGADYKALHGRVAERLPAVFATEGDVLLVTGSGSLVWEMALHTLVDGPVLSLVCGAFSARWHDVACAMGIDADRLEVPWGEAIDPQQVRERMGAKGYRAVTVVHSETSTGVLNPLREIAVAVRETSDALVLVDAVSSLGAVEVETDRWGLDLVFAGVQKALALPPGLAVVTVSERAWRRGEAVAIRGYSTDLIRLRDKHRERVTVSTPAIPQIRALDLQLERIVAEGLEERFGRHRTMQRDTAAFAADRGYRYASAPGFASPAVSCLEPPSEIDARSLVAALAVEGWTVGGGYGKWKPSTFRIGHMGEVTPRDVAALFDAIDAVAPGQ